MKNKITKLALLLTVFVFAVSCGQQPHKHEANETKTITKEQLAEGTSVEAACGECMFELPGNGCDLAVRINEKAYFVDGATIDNHGDAHADDGLCNAIREAKVKGQIVDGRFIAESFELIAHDDHEGHDHDDHDGHSH